MPDGEGREGGRNGKGVGGYEDPQRFLTDHTGRTYNIFCGNLYLYSNDIVMAIMMLKPQE